KRSVVVWGKEKNFQEPTAGNAPRRKHDPRQRARRPRTGSHAPCYLARVQMAAPRARPAGSMVGGVRHPAAAARAKSRNCAGKIAASAAGNLESCTCCYEDP